MTLTPGFRGSAWGGVCGGRVHLAKAKGRHLAKAAHIIKDQETKSKVRPRVENNLQRPILVTAFCQLDSTS